MISAEGAGETSLRAGEEHCSNAAQRPIAPRTPDASAIVKSAPDGRILDRWIIAVSSLDRGDGRTSARRRFVARATKCDEL
jgi:hypothetical protein